MRRVFLSYRREDSSDVTGRIYDRLVGHFGTDNVFKDVDSIPLGVDFRAHISSAVERCDVVLAVIGPRWLSAQDPGGSRRLDDPFDFVRLEVGAALERDIPVVPVIVGGAAVPAPEDLPEAIEELAFRNGTSVRPDPDFHRDMDRLIAALGEGKATKEQVTAPMASATMRAPVERAEAPEARAVPVDGGASQTTNAAPEYRYEIFLSFAAADREWVIENLYEPLRECRERGQPLRICLDWKDRYINQGRKSLKGLGEAIAASRQIVVAASKTYLDSSIGRWRLMRMADLEESSDRVVPILLDPITDVDGALGLTWLEIRGVEEWMARSLDPRQDDFFWALCTTLGVERR